MSNSNKTGLVTRIVSLGGKRTSFRLTPIELDALQDICSATNSSISRFCIKADKDFPHFEVRTQRIRSAILAHYLNKAGHKNLVQKNKNLDF